MPLLELIHHTGVTFRVRLTLGKPRLAHAVTRMYWKVWSGHPPPPSDRSLVGVRQLIMRTLITRARP